MSAWLQDLRFALRVLRLRPAVTAVILLTLALGIGANTAIFSVLDVVVLRPLAFPEPERIVEVERGFPEGNVPYVSPRAFRYWREHSRSFAAMAGWEGLGTAFNLSGGGGAPERIAGSRVTSDFYKVFGLRVSLGREFRPSDDLPAAQPVAILSHGLWRRRFAGDPGVLGRSLTLNGVSHLIIGIAPPGFRIPETAELWTSARGTATGDQDANTLCVSARLARGVSLSSVRAEMALVGRQFLVSGAAPEPDAPEVVQVTPLQKFLYGDLRPALFIMLASVALVLLIACANVANLQLARAVSRRDELAIRIALGAHKGSILRQLAVESVVLALSGGALGLLLSFSAIRPLLALSPMSIPRLSELGVDGRTLLFTLVVSLASGVLSGVVPGMHSLRAGHWNASLKGSLRSTDEVSTGRIRSVLVAAQVGLAVILMIGAALLWRNFLALRGTDPGFQPAHLLTLKMSPGEQYANPESLERLSRRLLLELAGVPGVDHAALATSLPLEPGADMPFLIAGRDPASRSGTGQGRYVAVGGAYFQALGIPVERGRALGDGDRRGSEPVAVINEAAARLFWPGENPLDQRIHLGLPQAPRLADPLPRRIVGVVGNVRELGLAQGPGPVIYVPMGQMAPQLTPVLLRILPVTLLVRSALPERALVQTIQSKVWHVDADQPVSAIRSMREIIARSLGSQKFNMLLLGILAGIALALAVVGIYGMLAYAVAQRAREIGIRVAMGAGQSQILGLVVKQLMKLVLAGIAAGLAGAFALTRFLASLLSGVGTADWASFVAVPALFVLVALLAAVIPTWRAIRLDPVRALKS